MGNGGHAQKNGKKSLEDMVHVYDTSAFVHDPSCLDREHVCKIVIPYVVIEELDKLRIEKTTPRAASAKAALKNIRAILKQEKRDIEKGCFLYRGKELYFRAPKGLLSQFPMESVPDNHILAVAYQAKDIALGGTINLITRDTGLNVKALCLGLGSTFYDLDFKVQADQRTISGVYITSRSTSQTILKMYCSPKRDKNEVFRIQRGMLPVPIYPNEFVLAKTAINEEIQTGAPPPAAETRTRFLPKQVILRYNPHESDDLVEYSFNKRGVSGIKPDGLQQQIALELLLDPEIHCVALVGEVGSGKTLLALAAGIEQVALESDQKVAEQIASLERAIDGIKKHSERRQSEFTEKKYDEKLINGKGKKGKRLCFTSDEIQNVYKNLVPARDVDEVHFKAVFAYFWKQEKKEKPKPSEQRGIEPIGRLEYNLFSQIWNKIEAWVIDEYQKKIKELDDEKEEKITEKERLKEKKGRLYDHIMTTRVFVPSGRDPGAMPGTEEEKTEPWMKGIKDNLDLLYEIASIYKDPEKFKKEIESKIRPLSTSMIRGASMRKKYFIIEEAQNLTSEQIKLLIGRAGKGTKVVLTGDLSQIDNPYLNKDTSGLNYLLQCASSNREFKYRHRLGIVYLSESKRSDLSKLALEMFKEIP